MPHCLRCERLGATCYGYSEDLPGTPEEMSERTGDAVSRLLAETNEAIKKQSNLYAKAAQQRSSGEEDTLDEPSSKTSRLSRHDTLDEPRTPKRSETDRRSRWETISPTVSEEREDSLKYGGIGKEAWLEMGGMSRSRGRPRLSSKYSQLRAFGSRT